MCKRLGGERRCCNYVIHVYLLFLFASGSSSALDGSIRVSWVAGRSERMTHTLRRSDCASSIMRLPELDRTVAMSRAASSFRRAKKPLFFLSASPMSLAGEEEVSATSPQKETLRVLTRRIGPLPVP